MSPAHVEAGSTWVHSNSGPRDSIELLALLVDVRLALLQDIFVVVVGFDEGVEYAMSMCDEDRRRIRFLGQSLSTSRWVCL